MTLASFTFSFTGNIITKTWLRYSRCYNITSRRILHSCGSQQGINRQRVGRIATVPRLPANARLGPVIQFQLQASRPRLLSASPTMTEASSSSCNLVVHHDPENSMFFINLVGEPEKAVLEYEAVDAKTVNLYHTGVPVSQRGKGVAKVIAKAALDHFASQRTRMKLTCTYLQKYIQENPSPLYTDLVVEL